MYTIESSKLRITISPKGAELQSVFHKENQLEHLWNGDPAYWSKRSPVLFPIVGALKNNTYIFQDKANHLPRHGFARDKEFSVEEQTENAIVFLLKDDEETRKNYPFRFYFYIKYTVTENELAVVYSIWNKGKEPMYFSVGGHPAFKIPLVEGTIYSDYQLVFNKTETAARWPISKDGLIEKEPFPFLHNTNLLPLNKELFLQDALVFKDLQSDTVSIKSDRTPHGISFQFPGFPYLGLWAAPGADFLCIEPWCGIADSVDSDQQLVNKEGINVAHPSELFEVSWAVSFF